jgi:hypothetical protein
MKSWEAKLLNLRIIHGAFLASIPLYAVIGEVAGPEQPGDFAVVRMVFFVASATGVLVGVQFRLRLLRAAQETLHREPKNPVALQQWMSGQIVSFAVAEAVAVCGLALRFLGGTLFESVPFYVVPFGLLLAWLPRRPD